MFTEEELARLKITQEELSTFPAEELARLRDFLFTEEKLNHFSENELIELFGGKEELAKLRVAGLPKQDVFTNNTAYLRLINRWLRARFAHHQYLDAQARGDTQGARAAISEHLRGYLEGHVSTVSREIVQALMVACMQSSAGELPELLAPKKRGRGDRESAALKVCIESGGRYIVFCQTHKGLPWVDQRPVKTVGELFGVDHRTASRWKGRVQEEDRLSLAFPLELGEEPTLPFDRVRASMRAAAVQYARFGGQSADAHRRRHRDDTR